MGPPARVRSGYFARENRPALVRISVDDKGKSVEKRPWWRFSEMCAVSVRVDRKVVGRVENEMRITASIMS